MEKCEHAGEIFLGGVDCEIHGPCTFGVCAICSITKVSGWECPYLKKTLNRKNRPCGCNKGEQSSEKKQQE